MSYKHGFLIYTLFLACTTATVFLSVIEIAKESSLAQLRLPPTYTKMIGLIVIVASCQAINWLCNRKPLEPREP
jgi:hypothetical protein